MRTYTVRPYFGHDCNSDSGFNNGYYLDDITVVAASEEDAIGRAMQAYITDHPLTTDQEVDGHFGDGTIYWITCYNDGNGNEISEQAYNDLMDTDPDEGGYLYQYIDFNNVEVESEGF